MVAYRTPGGPPSAMPPVPTVIVCRCCGVIAPESGTACAVCKRPLGEVRVSVPAQALDRFWVAVRCGFTCNSCKFLAPLDALDADGAVECAHCGLRQRFDVSAWSAALEHAHAVGDLAGPAPEGRSPHPTLWIGSENPHAAIGATATFASIESGVLSVEAAPGHPVCRACQVPVAVTVTAAGAVATRCPRCQGTATYATDDAARATSGALIAVVADEHRSDRPRAQATATQSGVIALKCPACGAPLGVPDRGGIATCTFCKAACIVPARVRTRARNETPEPDVWWILFQGTSPKRRELEQPTEDDAARVAGVVIDLLKPGAKTTPIGDAPGVYEAPEVPGIYWPQVGLTVAVGSLAVVLGMIVFELLR